MNGIGATDELSLRVSVATLIRVLFKNPKDGDLLLALERKATFFEEESGQFIVVKAQPFGGAIRVIDPIGLQRMIGEFHFDNQESYSEQDFRLFIRPSAWETVRQFCLQHFTLVNDSVIESNPIRELAEEFASALKVSLQADQYSYRLVETIAEDVPSPTENFYSRGFSTVRIYYIFEAHILDPSLVDVMLMNNARYSDLDLRELALQDFQNGGYGWYSAVLTLPLNQISDTYSFISLEARNHPIWFQNHQLDETVAAILEGINVPKYRRLPTYG